MSQATTYFQQGETVNRGVGLDKRVVGVRVGLIALIAIVALAAFIRFYNLEAVGYGNLYYTAAIESMLQSWHNFFFAAAEPGASVTVDKPPVGLWLQAISAYFLGVNGFAVLLPQVIAGILSVPVVYVLVRRYAGEPAGLLAALIVALTPVSIAADRNNTMDSTLIFTLLLAAWAFMNATDRGKLSWLLAGAALVGLAFNIKMLQAFLPLPAFYALYFLGSRQGWFRKAFNLILASVLLAVVSLSWAVAVDLTPADERPYVGSSSDNTVMELIVGHNGMARLFAGNRGGGPGGPPAGAATDGGAIVPQGGQNLPPGGFTPPQGAPPQAGAGGITPQPGAGGVGAQGNQPPGGQGGMFGDETGQPGVLRLFTAPLSNEIGWLLPFGLLSLGIVAFSAPIRWPLSDQHKALVLWGGALVTMVIFFSMAGLFHAYYLAMLAAPLAATAAMGAVGLWRMQSKLPALAWVLMVVLAVGTLAFQAYTAAQYSADLAWLALPAGFILIGGGALMLFGYARSQQRVMAVGAACLLVATLIIPAAWSFLTMMDDRPNASLPSAYEGGALDAAGPIGGSLAVDQTVLDYLQANTVGVEYMLAVMRASDGASYVIASGRPVLYMGGFSGGDAVVSVSDLQEMVAEGRLRYVLWREDGRGQRGNQEIGNWLQSSCSEVTEISLSAPSGPGGGQGGGPGGGSSTLYQCGG